MVNLRIRNTLQTLVGDSTDAAFLTLVFPCWRMPLVFTLEVARHTYTILVVRSLLAALAGGAVFLF